MDRFVNPPIWHKTLKHGGRIIIAIDKQKPWERITDFSKRVTNFLKGATGAHGLAQRLRTRVFVGGLHDTLQDIVLEKGTDISFSGAILMAELLEMAFVASVGAKDPYETDLARKMQKMSRYGPPPYGRFCKGHKGVRIFGVPSARVDKLYKSKYDLQLKILYR